MKSKILPLFISILFVGGYIAYATNDSPPEEELYLTKKEFEEAKIALKNEIKEEILKELKESEMPEEKPEETPIEIPSPNSYFNDIKTSYYPGEELYFNFQNGDTNEHSLRITYKGDVGNLNGMTLIIRNYKPYNDHYVWTLSDTMVTGLYEAYIEKDGVKLESKEFTVLPPQQ